MPVNVFPPSIDFQTTTLAVYTTSGLAGSTFTSAKSSGRPAMRPSSVVRFQLSPASSER